MLEFAPEAVEAALSLIGRLGADADYLLRMAGLAKLSLDAGGGKIDPAAWAEYTSSNDATATSS